jgi:hypothetical protein
MPSYKFCPVCGARLVPHYQPIYDSTASLIFWSSPPVSDYHCPDCGTTITGDTIHPKPPYSYSYGNGT